MERDHEKMMVQLDALLENFEEGKFKNVSTIDESGVTTLKITQSVNDDGTPRGAVYESRMDEHEMTVNQVLQLWKNHFPAARKR